MQIQVDTREHKKEWERIQLQFDALGVEYFRSKLYVGDYMSLDNPRLVIDRKKDLQELCGNVCQQHERFKKELLRANKANIEVIVLCENGAGIESLEDVYFWDNPRLHESEWKMVDGHPQKVLKNPKAISGQKLYKTLSTISKEYGVQFLFCKKCDTGQRIVELLGGSNGE